MNPQTALLIRYDCVKMRGCGVGIYETHYTLLPLWRKISLLNSKDLNSDAFDQEKVTDSATSVLLCQIVKPISCTWR